MTKRRPSRTSSNHSSISSSCSNNGDVFLSSRTRKSISKSSRRSSAEENNKPSSRRTSLVVALSLLSLPSLREDVPQLMGALEVHADYKIKVRRSNKKLERFFGENTIPVDVCVNEIRKEGLKAMLESKVPLCYFLYHLLQEFSSENLFFFLKVEQFENYYNTQESKNSNNFNNERKEAAMAQHIFDSFVSGNSSLEINLDDRIKQKISKQILHGNITSSMFMEAKTSVYILLESSFSKFLQNNVFSDMATNFSSSSSKSNDCVTRMAIDYLLEYLVHQQTIIRAHSREKRSDGSSMMLLQSNLKKHYELVKVILEEFLTDMFGINYLITLPSAALLPTIKSKQKITGTKERRRYRK